MKIFKLSTFQIWNYLIFTFFLFVASLLYYLNGSGEFSLPISILILLINLHSCFKVRHQWYLLVIYGVIFYSNYSICMANYIAPIENYFTAWKHTAYSIEGLHILLFFSLLLNLIIPQHISKKPILPLIQQNRRAPILSMGILGVLILVGIFEFNHPDLAGTRGMGTAIYEYSIIGFIIGLYYTGKIQWLQLLYALVGSFFVFQNFIFGGRIEGLQIILLFILAFFSNKLRVKYVFPLLVIGLILLTGIGQFRAEFKLNIDSFLEITNRLTHEYLVTDTAYAAYFASLTFLAVLPFTPWTMRLKFFQQFLMYIFVGSRLSGFDPWGYTKGFFVHYGGGLLPFFAYFYLGVVGVILLALYLRFLLGYIAIVSECSSGFLRCITLYLTVTVFRWYLYGPSQLTRGCLLVAICYFSTTVYYKLHNEQAGTNILLHNKKENL